MSRIDEGRNVDLHVGSLAGEAAQMWVERAGADNPLGQLNREIPSAPGPSESPTYYEQPVVKAPPWIWYIPAYFYLGGLSGSASALAAALQVLGGRRELVVRARWVAAGGIVLGSGFLIADLGRPERFLHMLRVFRPTSPMNVGTWSISLAGVTTTAAVVGRGPFRAIGDAAGLVAGVNGPFLATYTAVLLANTAIPVWSRARLSLPLLFAASAVSSAASVLQMVDDDPVLERLGRPAKLLDLVAMHLLEAEVGSARVRAPLRSGPSGAMWRAARVLGAASLVASMIPGRSRRKRVAAGLLGTAAAMLVRGAVLEAGKASARDPRATFEGQRR